MVRFLVLPLLLVTIICHHGNVNGLVVDKLLAPIINTVVPSVALQPCTLNVDTILSVIFAKSGPLQCNMCDVVADLTEGVTGFLDKTDRAATEQIVDLYCVKAKTTNVFRLDVSSPNILAQFDRKAQLAFLIHGFTDSYPGNLLNEGQGWMQHAILNWAKQGINVCAVDWGKLSLEKLNYFVVSQKNTQRVADFLSELLLRFESAGVDLSKTTLAGHSLGAQISGKTGSILKSKGKALGSIYGLDPAGPCYTFPCTVDEKYRLDASDANYVQCIHSNIGVLGQIPRCGCSDIYLNSGVVQPRNIDPITAHYFACFLFDWTLNPNNQCVSVDGKDLVGVHNNKSCGVLRVLTNGETPYCSKSTIGRIVP